jgi:hypothetical protein
MAHIFLEFLVSVDILLYGVAEGTLGEGWSLLVGCGNTTITIIITISICVGGGMVRRVGAAPGEGLPPVVQEPQEERVFWRG